MMIMMMSRSCVIIRNNGSDSAVAVTVAVAVAAS